MLSPRQNQLINTLNIILHQAFITNRDNHRQSTSDFDTLSKFTRNGRVNIFTFLINRTKISGHSNNRSAHTIPSSLIYTILPPVQLIFLKIVINSFYTSHNSCLITLFLCTLIRLYSYKIITYNTKLLLNKKFIAFYGKMKLENSIRRRIWKNKQLLF
ncbi:hypothetical protein SANR_1883 [Streptococcus anginosus C238]|nr:hypothetical protein SANR_1883 [Streptococcus anginosus C238]